MLSCRHLLLTILANSLIANAADVPVQINFSNLEQEYTGSALIPAVSSQPSGLQVILTSTPRNSQIVYNTIPSVLPLSHSSVPIQGSQTLAFGDQVTLGAGNRRLESIDAVFVTQAKAADWQSYSQATSRGYFHPFTVFIYGQASGGELTLLDQKTQNVLVPWCPTTLDDGSAYPHNGVSFPIRFNFAGDKTLPETIAVMVAYNTQSGGFNPIGQSGPYNLLNVALQPSAPTVGTDHSPTNLLRYTTRLVSTNYGNNLAPLLTVRSFPAAPPTENPVDAGVYRIKATVTSPGYVGEAFADLVITPSPATITTSNLRQVATGGPKSITAGTMPSGLPLTVLYNGSTTPPSVKGTYPVIVQITDKNRSSRRTATMLLGDSFQTWITAYANSHQLTGVNVTAHGDPDKDGIPNLLEFAFGLSPVQPRTSAKAYSNPEFQVQNSQSSLNYRRNKFAMHLSYQVQTTTDLNLTAWTNVSGTGAVVGADGDDQLIRFDLPSYPPTSKRFFRLKVEEVSTP